MFGMETSQCAREQSDPVVCVQFGGREPSISIDVGTSSVALTWTRLQAVIMVTEAEAFLLLRLVGLQSLDQLIPLHHPTTGIIWIPARDRQDHGNHMLAFTRVGFTRDEAKIFNAILWTQLLEPR